jgi:NAD(P)-dependent dehydrogenase (short-subunit alcohol dehydrogenase family)
VSERVAIVTGAARGIGLAVAARLIADGGVVAAVDRDEERLRTEVQRFGGRAVAIVADVTDGGAADGTVADVLRRFGRIDVLVNNAGIGGRTAATWEQTDADWQDVIAVNLTAVFRWTRAVLPAMRERRYGRIVNVASIAGKEGNPNAVPYAASKAGVIGLTKAVAKEVATEGILVNCVTPAVIRTEILEQVSEEFVGYMLSRIPMGRQGEPEEVAELIAWLASDRCSFSTGAVFDVSGGRATY